MTLRQIIDEMRELADQIAAAEINGFGNSVTHLADTLESALAQEGQAVAYLRRLPDGYHSLTVRTPEQMKALDALPPETALYARPAAPVAQDGWKLVPVEPTPEMLREMEKHWSKGSASDMARREYLAALVAAPTPDGEAKK